MAKRRIHSKGTFRQDEAVAGEAGIYPGMLLEVNSSGNVIKHDDEGGRAEKLVAQEDVLQGNTVSTVYTSGGIVTYIIPHQGSEVNVLIKAGQGVSIGDELISAGDGTFKVATDIASGNTVDEVLFVATEACDLTASGAVNTLCAARAK